MNDRERDPDAGMPPQDQPPERRPEETPEPPPAQPQEDPAGIPQGEVPPAGSVPPSGADAPSGGTLPPGGPPPGGPPPGGGTPPPGGPPPWDAPPPGSPPPSGGSRAATSSPIEAFGLAFEFLKKDFLNLWLMTLVFWVITMVVGLLTWAVLGLIPCIGPLASLVVSIFVNPPLVIGLYYATEKGMDTGRADVANLFEGFKQRYLQSVIAMVIPLIVWFVVSMLFGVSVLGSSGITMALTDGEAPGLMLVPMVGLGLVFLLVALVLTAFFVFIPVAVWEHPESGWEALMASVRMVMARFVPALLFVILMAVVFIVAAVAGILVCGVGLIVTLPVAQVWAAVATILLYRGWRQNLTA